MAANPLDKKLITASEDGVISRVYQLLNSGARANEPEQYAARAAARNGHVNTLQALVKYGADLHCHDGILLELAIFNNHIDVAQYLVKQDVGVANSKLLKYAIEVGRLEIVKLLLNKGVNPFEQVKQFDVEGSARGTLKSACERGYSGIVQHFAETGLINNADFKGIIPKLLISKEILYVLEEFGFAEGRVSPSRTSGAKQ